MSVHTDPLVEDYMRRLEAVSSVLPGYRRDELPPLNVLASH